MRVLKIIAAIAIAVGFTGAAITASTTADITGSYQGDLVVEGQPPLSTLLELKQDGTALTGKVGAPNKPEEMIAVTGTITDSTVSLTGKPPVDNMTVTFALKVEGTHLKGTATFDMGAQKIDFTVDLVKK